MNNYAPQIQAILDKRDKEKAIRDEKERKRQADLAKKIARATIAKLPPLWWIPAFLRTRVQIQKRNAELSRMISQHQEFTARQSQDMRKLFQLCIQFVPQDHPGWKEFREYLDPSGIHGSVKVAK